MTGFGKTAVSALTAAGLLLMAAGGGAEQAWGLWSERMEAGRMKNVVLLESPVPARRQEAAPEAPREEPAARPVALAAQPVMEMAAAYPEAAGFCWDTGHEMCYNYSMDMPGRYPGKLLATHINDNLGIRDFGGAITWHDDLHLLPFDGAGDWDGIARRLADFDGPLTFELTTHSKPDRHESDKYGRLSPEEYLAEAYARACRLAAMVKRARAER